MFFWRCDFSRILALLRYSNSSLAAIASKSALNKVRLLLLCVLIATIYCVRFQIRCFLSDWCFSVSTSFLVAANVRQTFGRLFARRWNSHRDYREGSDGNRGQHALVAADRRHHKKCVVFRSTYYLRRASTL